MLLRLDARGDERVAFLEVWQQDVFFLLRLIRARIDGREACEFQAGTIRFELAAIACSNVKNVYPTKKDNDFVDCKITKSGEPIFTISIRVKQGSDIVKVCNKIQDEIRESVLLMSGIECNQIDIDIQGFELEKK